MTGLVFGSLDLMGGGLVKLEALGSDSGTDWGNPGPIETQLNSFLQYGALVASEGYENRTVMVAVSARGRGPVRAAAEAALAGEIRKRNVLLYTPPDSTVVTRFEVLTSSFDQIPDDLLEKRRGEKIYMLRLVALPFAFSADEVVTAPFTPPTTVTTVVVDDGSSVGSWTGSPNTVTVSGGAVQETRTDDTSFATVDYVASATRTSTIATSSTPYLAIDYSTSVTLNSGYPGLSNVQSQVLVDGAALTPISTTTLPNGYTRLWVQAPGSSVGSIQVNTTYRVSNPLTNPGGRSNVTAVVRIDQIQRSNSYATVSSTKQLTRTLSIAGTAPTTGSIAIEHPSAALGDVLLYTCATSYTCALRSFRTSGPSNPTPDGTTVSGAYDVLNGQVKYTVPYTALPEGEYLLMARVQTTAPTAIACTIAAVSGNYSPASVVVSANVGTLSSWTFVRLGMVHLPLIDAGPSTTLTFGLTRTAGTVSLDEFYLFNLTTGDLTQVACGSGTPTAGNATNRLWIDSPSVENDGLGAMLRGVAATRADAISAYIDSTSPGVHEFPAGSVMAFTVTSAADSAAISFRHRPAWFHTAGALNAA